MTMSAKPEIVDGKRIWTALSADTPYDTTNKTAGDYLFVDNGDVLQFNGVSWDQKSTAGAGRVTINGVITAVSGTPKSHVMEIKTAALSGADGVAQQWVGTCKAYRIFVPKNDNAAGAYVAYADSTTEADQTAIATRVNDFVTAANAAAGDGVAHECNILDIGLNKGRDKSDWVFWDGTTTIKTIGLRGGATDAGTPGFPHSVILQTIE